MIVGIMSDTHGAKADIERAVRLIPDADCWLHAGDYSQDADYLAKLAGKKVYAAMGNCDGYDTPAKIDEYVTLGNRHIWITHGHHYDVKHTVRELVYWAEQYEADIVVYGHTHIPKIEKIGKKYFVNPGSAKYGKTCIKLIIEKETATFEILPFPQK